MWFLTDKSKMMLSTHTRVITKAMVHRQPLAAVLMGRIDVPSWGISPDSLQCSPLVQVNT